jgi:F-type H+-transporting ATPase subunit epsilon
MADALHVTVTSVAEKLFDGQAQSVTVPGADGVLEVLAHHEPFVSTLRAGTVVVKVQGNEDKTFDIGEGGVIEVSNNHATVLL